MKRIGKHTNAFPVLLQLIYTFVRHAVFAMPKLNEDYCLHGAYM